MRLFLDATSHRPSVGDNLVNEAGEDAQVVLPEDITSEPSCPARRRWARHRHQTLVDGRRGPRLSSPHETNACLHDAFLDVGIDCRRLLR
jgi:hypothetical protein